MPRYPKKFIKQKAHNPMWVMKEDDVDKTLTQLGFVDIEYPFIFSEGRPAFSNKHKLMFRDYAIELLKNNSQPVPVSLRCYQVRPIKPFSLGGTTDYDNLVICEVDLSRTLDMVSEYRIASALYKSVGGRRPETIKVPHRSGIIWRNE